MRHKVFIPILDTGDRAIDPHWITIGALPCWERCLRNLAQFDLFVDTNSAALMEAIRAAPDMGHATVYLRDRELMGDKVPVNTLIQGFLDRYGIHHEVIAQCHANAPFLRGETVEAAFAAIGVDSDYDSVIAVTEFRGRFWREDRGEPIPVNHNPMVLKRSDDLEPCYVENSAFYVFHASSFRAIGNRIGTRPVFHPVDFPENLRFRTAEDYQRFHSRLALIHA